MRRRGGEKRRGEERKKGEKDRRGERRGVVRKRQGNERTGRRGRQKMRRWEEVG